MAYYNPNQQMINQLMRQKDNVENLISQYSQPPVQNIITTGTDFEAKIIDDEDINNILINKRTMFLDKKNKKVMVKELDGKISEEYEIIIPLDELGQMMKSSNPMQMMSSMLNPQQKQMLSQFQNQPQEQQAQKIAEYCNQNGITKTQLQNIIKMMNG